MERKRPIEYPNEYISPKKTWKEIFVNEQEKKNDLHSSSDSPAKVGSVEKIPIEILTHIFSFISPRDRRRAKLVCKKWHEAGSSLSFSYLEKKVFRDLYNIKEMLLLLSETQDKFLNLEFHNMKFIDPSILVSLKAKIYFLSFVECEFNDDIICEFIINCDNLQQFCWQGKNLCFTKNVLNMLKTKQFRNINLKKLKIFAQNADISNDHVHLLFQIFPNIRELSFQMSTLVHYENKDAVDDLFSFSSVIKEVLSSRHVLKKLKVTLYEPQWRLIASHNFTRLKEISVFIPDDVSDKLVFDFFARHESLERISCTTIKNNPFPTHFMEHLVHHCRQLKHVKLKFRISCVISLSRETFYKLASLKLITLEIFNADIIPDHSFSMSNYYFANETLRVLCIPLIIDYRIQLLFIQCFKNLRQLELQCIAAVVLESIGEFQQNLMVLKLNLPSRVQPDLSNRLPGFPDTWISWSDTHIEMCLRLLSSLESLSLTVQCELRTFNGDCIPVSVKYFHLYVDGLWRLPPSFSLLPLKKLTDLEIIRFGLGGVSTDNLNTWLEVCNSLGKLRQLHIDSTHRSTTTLRSCCFLEALPCSAEEYENIFNCCPSLRLLVHRTTKGHVMYYYDYWEEKMKRKEDIADFMVTERIGGLKVKYRL